MAILNEPGYEIILINDHSKDDTLHSIVELSKRFNNVRIVHFAANFGQHSAIMAGLRQAQGDIIINLDDDMQTPTSEIPKLIAKLNEGYDAVYGKYAEAKTTTFRRLGTWVNGLTTKWLLGRPPEIQVTSYLALRRFVRDEMIRYSNPYPHIPGLIFRITKNVGNAEIRHESRATGKSGYTLKKLLRVWSSCTNYSLLPLRFGTVTGIVCACLGIIGMIVLFIRRLIEPSVTAGWTSLMMIILFMGGLILISIGLVGEYIGRMFISINATPQYVIKDTYNIGRREDKGEQKHE